MSFDTDRNFVYSLHGKKMRLYRYRSGSSRLVDTQGRVSAESWDELIYPDETIANGLRIEYGALVSPFVVEDPESTDIGSLTEVSAPKEASHVNLNRMLSVAVVEYVKAHLSERAGNVDAKEYFMRQFFNKLSDNESNKNKVHIAHAVSPYAL